MLTDSLQYVTESLILASLGIWGIYCVLTKPGSMAGLPANYTSQAVAGRTPRQVAKKLQTRAVV
jgi:hypothetical protein